MIKNNTIMINCITNSNILSKSLEFVEENDYKNVVENEFKNMCTRFGLNESEMISVIMTKNILLLDTHYETIWDSLNFYSMQCIDEYKNKYIESLYKTDLMDARIELLCDDLKEYIKHNSCINVETDKCNTFKIACTRQHDECVKYLINDQDKIVQKNVTNIVDHMYLCGASYNIIKYLLEEKNATCSDNTIDYACGHGHLDIVKYLFEVHNKNCTDKGMKLACIYGHSNIIKYLFETHGKKCTYYHVDLACERGHFDIIKYAFEVQQTDCFGHGIYSACKNGNLDIVKYLLGKQCCTRIDFRIMADFACKYGHLDIVKYLLEERNIKFYNRHFKYACSNKHLYIVKYLLKKYSFGHYDYKTCFEFVCENEHLNIAMYMIKKDRSVSYGGIKKVIRLFLKKRQLNCAKYLIELCKYKITNYDINYFATRGDLYILKYLVENSNVDKFNNTIKLAKKNNHIDVINYLSEKQHNKKEHKKKSWLEK